MVGIFGSLNKAVENFFMKANLAGKDLSGFAIGEVANKANAVVNNFFVGLSATMEQADERIKGQIPEICGAFTKALDECQCATRGEVDNVFDRIQKIVSQLPLTDQSPQVLNVSKSIFVNPGDTEVITFSGVFKHLKAIQTVAKLTVLNQDGEEWDCRLSGNETDHKLGFEIPKAVFSKDLTRSKVSKVRAKLELPLSEKSRFFNYLVTYNFTFYAIQKIAGKVKVVFEDTIQEAVVKAANAQFHITNTKLNQVTIVKSIEAPSGWQVVPQSMQAFVSIDKTSFNVVSCEVDHKLNSCTAVIKGKHKRGIPIGVLVVDYKITQMLAKQVAGESPADNFNFDEPCLFPIVSGTRRITCIQLTDIFNRSVELPISQKMIVPKSTEGYFTITREYGRLMVLASSGEVIRCIPGNYFSTLDKKNKIPAIPQTGEDASAQTGAAAASAETAVVAEPAENSHLTKIGIVVAAISLVSALLFFGKRR